MNMHTALPALPNPDESTTFIRSRSESTTVAGRSDGWTPERQRAFLEAVAEGATVEAACRHVGLSVTAAYAFKKRAAGATFALGWRAASLVARDRVADTLLTRALDGQVETWTRADGATVSRHRYDNRLAAQLLARLDRLADQNSGDGTHHAARLVAQDFDAFLDLVEGDAAPARAGLFLANRSVGDSAPDLAPITALARADCWLRTGATTGGQVTTADLDPARRAGWTAEQWTRAEAAGLLALAPAPKLKSGAPEPQLPALAEPDEPEGPVWWCSYADAWRTRFPPPPDFCGEEDGRYGDEGYERELTPEEEEAVDAPHNALVEELRAVEEVERVAFFKELTETPLPDQREVGGESAVGDAVVEPQPAEPGGEPVGPISPPASAAANTARPAPAPRLRCS